MIKKQTKCEMSQNGESLTNSGILLTVNPRYMNTKQEFFKMSYSQHIKDQMPRKNELNILFAFLHNSGLLIYLKLKIKISFLRII